MNEEVLSRYSLQEIAVYCRESENNLTNLNDIEEDVILLRREISRNGLSRINARAVDAIHNEGISLLTKMGFSLEQSSIGTLSTESYNNARPYQHADKALTKLDVALEASKLAVGLLIAAAVIGVIYLIYKLVGMNGKTSSSVASVEKSIKESEKKLDKTIDEAERQDVDLDQIYRNIEGVLKDKLMKKHPAALNRMNLILSGLIEDEDFIERMSSEFAMMPIGLEMIRAVSIKLSDEINIAAADIKTKVNNGEIEDWQEYGERLISRIGEELGLGDIRVPKDRINSNEKANAMLAELEKGAAILISDTNGVDDFSLYSSGLMNADKRSEVIAGYTHISNMIFLKDEFTEEKAIAHYLEPLKKLSLEVDDINKGADDNLKQLIASFSGLISDLKLKETFISKAISVSLKFNLSKLKFFAFINDIVVELDKLIKDEMKKVK